MEYKITKRDSCRICASRELKRFLHFDSMPFADGFVTGDDYSSEFLADLDVYFCPACRSAQTQHDVEVSGYYQDYHYTVSASPLVQNFMRRLAEETFSRFGLKPGDNVIEIGSSDGYQLSCFQKVGANVLGFEPSDPLVKASHEAGVPTLQRLFNADTVDEIPQDMRPAQVVVALHTLDHLPNPLEFLHAIKKVLDPERGVLVFEVHDLEKIYERREACIFAHDHSIYLDARSMRDFLKRAGFKLLTENLIPENERRGNSLTIAAALEESSHQADEFDMRDNLRLLEKPETFENFGNEVYTSYKKLADYIRSRKNEGAKIGGYSAGGRTVMSLAMADLSTEDMVYLVDRNTNLHGLSTARSHIRVYPPEHVFEHPADELIVFSYGYMGEIREQLAPFIDNGGRLTSLLDLL